MTNALTAVTALAAAALMAMPLAASAAPAPTDPIELRPGTLERGADVRIPHLEGDTIVDGGTRIPLAGEVYELLGRSGAAYVVVVGNAGGTRFRTVRVSLGGDPTLLARATTPGQATLSDDGRHLAVERGLTEKDTTIQVVSAQTSQSVARRTFPGFVSVLDMSGGRLVLGSWAPNRTFFWNALTGDTRTIVNRPGYVADIAGDRLAVFTRDPFRGGCSVVTPLTEVTEVDWRSCEERVDAFSPGGTRMATVHLLADGLGPTRVWARKTGGKLLAGYTTRWFGLIGWESETALLLETNGRKLATTARCIAADCEAAEDTRPAPTPRVSP
ncbi:MAG: hypothetical protein WKF79_10505 [Nocardioides sp.]